MLERNATFLKGQGPGRPFIVHKVTFAKHFDVATKRNSADFPACIGFVSPADQFRPESDRKNFNPDAASTRHPVVAHFMDKHQNGQNHNKGQEVFPNNTEIFPLYACYRHEMPFPIFHRKFCDPAGFPVAFPYIVQGTKGNMIEFCQNFLNNCGNIQKADLTVQKALHSDFICPRSVQLVRFRHSSRPRVQAAGPEKRIGSGGSKVSCDNAARSSFSCGTFIRCGPRQGICNRCTHILEAQAARGPSHS